MIKRATGVRLLPEPSSFGDWKDWARQLNVELTRQLLATSMLLPFFEYGQVERTNDYTPTGVGIPWEVLKYDNTNGIWVVANPTRLTVPERAGLIKYGHAQVHVQLSLTDPGAAVNELLVQIHKNGAAPDPRGSVKYPLVIGQTRIVQAFSPWCEVNAGDYFEIIVTRTGAGTSVIDAGIDTWTQLFLGGPA